MTEDIEGLVPDIRLEREMTTARVVPRCRICGGNDGSLELVNHLLAAGQSYKGILEACKAINEARPSNKKINYATIGVHAREHMPMRQAAVRRFLEQKAQRAGKDFEKGVESLLNPMNFAEAMMQKSFVDMTTDEDVRISPKDGLEAAKAVHAFIKDEQNSRTVEEAYSQMNAIIAAVKQVCTEDQMKKIVEEVARVQALEGR